MFPKVIESGRFSDGALQKNRLEEVFSYDSGD